MGSTPSPKSPSQGMKVMITPSPNDLESQQSNGSTQSHKVDMSGSYSPTEQQETDLPNWFGHSLDTIHNHPNDPSTNDPFDFFDSLNGTSPTTTTNNKNNANNN